MVSDTIGDFIIRIKNAGMIKKETISVPHSKLKLAVAEKLKQSGYISDVTVKGKSVQTKVLEITLRYDDAGTHQVHGVKRISKPGRRLYTGVAELHPIKFGKGHLILSTPAGILTNEEAKAKNVGGEQLFIIW